MQEIIVQGGQRLEGSVKVEGAKNAVLPILAASLLAEEGVTELSNCLLYTSDAADDVYQV